MCSFIHRVYLGFLGGQIETENLAASQSLQSCVEQDIICGPFCAHTTFILDMADVRISNNLCNMMQTYQS